MSLLVRGRGKDGKIERVGGEIEKDRVNTSYALCFEFVCFDGKDAVYELVTDNTFAITTCDIHKSCFSALIKCGYDELNCVFVLKDSDFYCLLIKR